MGGQGGSVQGMKERAQARSPGKQLHRESTQGTVQPWLRPETQGRGQAWLCSREYERMPEVCIKGARQWAPARGHVA